MNNSDYSIANVEKFLKAFYSSLTDIYADKIICIYLWGSVVTSAYVPGLSDVDILVVTKDKASTSEYAKLQKWSRVLLKEEPLSHIIDAYFATIDDIKNNDGRKSYGGLEFWKNELTWTTNGLGDNPIVIEAVLRTGRRLYGQDLSDVIEPVSNERIKNAIIKELTELEAGIYGEKFNDPDYRRYVISTLARIIYRVEKGEQASKLIALEYVVDAYPEFKSLAGITIDVLKNESHKMPEIDKNLLLQMHKVSYEVITEF